LEYVFSSHSLYYHKITRALQRLKFLIAINLTIKKLISVNRTFNLTQKIVCLCVWLLMRVCECVGRGYDEVSDEEAGDKMTSVMDDSSFDECSAAEHSSELESSQIINYSTA